jgi:hypothetical protein
MEKEKNKKENEKKENEKKENEKLNEIDKKSLLWSIILGDPNLDDLRIIFILMIILPFSSFFISRHFFYKYNFNIDKINLYSFLICIITIWLILISMSIYFFKSDFQKVFCPKKNEQKKKKEE